MSERWPIEESRLGRLAGPIAFATAFDDGPAPDTIAGRSRSVGFERARSRHRPVLMTAAVRAPTAPDRDVVAAVLGDYARRGVFRAFGEESGSGRTVTFRVVWHFGQRYEVVFDGATGTLRIPSLLPDVPQQSTMYRELKAFLRSRLASELPEHRRVDSARAALRPYNRAGRVSLSLRSLDGDLEYSTRKLVQVVHEVFVAFLRDGPYYEYLVETFGLEPDTM